MYERLCKIFYGIEYTTFECTGIEWAIMNFDELTSKNILVPEIIAQNHVGII